MNYRLHPYFLEIIKPAEKKNYLHPHLILGSFKSKNPESFYECKFIFRPFPQKSTGYAACDISLCFLL